MLERVISGGQTGADQAGWRAAKAAGIRTGGTMPLGWLTEEGPRPEFETLYGAHCLSAPDYHSRTRANVRDSDATLWFGSPHTPGARATFNATWPDKPLRAILLEGRPVKPSEIAAWLSLHKVKVLNIAGNRESTAPGIGLRVEAFLGRLFGLLAKEG